MHLCMELLTIIISLNHWWKLLEFGGHSLFMPCSVGKAGGKLAVYDIEDLVKEGHDTQTCPYHASMDLTGEGAATRHECCSWIWSLR